MTKVSTPPAIPSDVQIGPHCYEVRTDRQAVIEASWEMDGKVFGHSTHDRLVITVDERMAPSMMADTLLHEVLHAAFDMTGLASELDEKLAESAIRRLSPLLLDVLRRNRALVSYLCATISE